MSTANYQPFGEVYSVTSSEDYLFTGKERDETDLYYFGARYYDCEVGSFVTRDAWRGKISIPENLNRYTYCYNNPLRYVDPWGNMAEVIVGFVAASAPIPVWGLRKYYSKIAPSYDRIFRGEDEGEFHEMNQYIRELLVSGALNKLREYWKWGVALAFGLSS